MMPLRTNGDYCFSNEEESEIETAVGEMHYIITKHSLTYAEAFEALDRCKSLIEMSIIGIRGDMKQ